MIAVTDLVLCLICGYFNRSRSGQRKLAFLSRIFHQHIWIHFI